MGKIRQIGLSYAILSLGDDIRHKTAGYTAKIISLDSRRNGKITVTDTPENRLIWTGTNLPFTFKAKNLFKHFSKLQPQYKLL